VNNYIKETHECWKLLNHAINYGHSACIKPRGEDQMEQENVKPEESIVPESIVPESIADFRARKLAEQEAKGTQPKVPLLYSQAMLQHLRPFKKRMRAKDFLDLVDVLNALHVALHAGNIREVWVRQGMIVVLCRQVWTHHGYPEFMRELSEVITRVEQGLLAISNGQEPMHVHTAECGHVVDPAPVAIDPEPVVADPEPVAIDPEASDAQPSSN
jgi:hypothetical protein